MFQRLLPGTLVRNPLEHGCAPARGRWASHERGAIDAGKAGRHLIDGDAVSRETVADAGA